MTPAQFPALVVDRKTGAERFHSGERPLAFDLLSFWQWVASDLTNNALRGTLAEYLVAQAIGTADGVRVEWDRYDLRTLNGVTVEVKSAAYFQTWAQERLSKITFDIAPKLAWDPATSKWETAARRQADVYVFALLNHPDKTTLNPLDMGQWEFFVLHCRAIDAFSSTQQRVSLSTLRGLRPVEAKFTELRDAIERVAAEAA